jgi:acetyl esterase/lipase
MFHAGGFVLGTSQLLADSAEIARNIGFKPVLVEYTKADPARALQDARKAAKTNSKGRRDVVTYGESAGGTLSARLAQAGLVEAATTYSPIADVQKFADRLFNGDEVTEQAFLGTEAEQARVSPRGRDSKAPILALLASEESLSFAR